MDFQKDFAELCALLNAKSVDYLIVSGYAVAFHGAPRFTGDLDILISPDSGQIECVLTEGKFKTPDLGGASHTGEVTSAVIQRIAG